MYSTGVGFSQPYWLFACPTPSVFTERADGSIQKTSRMPSRRQMQHCACSHITQARENFRAPSVQPSDLPAHLDTSEGSVQRQEFDLKAKF